MFYLLLAVTGGVLLFAGGAAFGRYGARRVGYRQIDQESIAVLHEIAAALSRDVSDHEHRVRTIAADLEALPSPRESDVAECVRQIVEASDALRRKLQEAERRVEEQARLMREQAEAARTDSLTLLRNRGALDDCLDDRLRAGRERNEMTSFLLLDIDHFKRVNDAHGHLAGDSVLRAVARTLTEASPSDAFVARFGGEEFAVVFPHRGADEARTIAESIRSRVGETVVSFDDTRIRITASAGLAETKAGDDRASWIRRVDEGLYDAKARGRNIGIWRCGEAMLPFSEAEGDIGQKTLRTSRLSSTEEARLDPVTGLSNRASFLADLRRRHAQLRRAPGTASLAMLRIDGYDQMIARCGFRAAEQALLFVSRALRTSIRESDHVARFGREIFAIHLPEASSEDAVAIGDRLRAEIDRPFATIEGEPVRLQTSFVAIDFDAALELDELVAECRQTLDGDLTASL